MTWEKEINAMNSERNETAIYTSMWLDLNNSFGHIESNGQASYRFSDDKSETCLKSALAALEERKNDPNNKEKQDKFEEEKTKYDEAVKKLLVNIFIPKVDKDQKGCFKDKYDMAVSGSGNESFKITTLHSSSLCCLLFFYNVTENNPLALTLKTNKGGKTVQKTVIFTDSVFEFKNKVLNAPSNIDVVLIGKVIDKGEDKDKTVLFFLESKFAEYYLSSGGTCNIGEGYLDYYSDQESGSPGAEICRDFYRIEDQDNTAIDLKKIHNALNNMPIEKVEKEGIVFDLPKLAALGLKIKIKKEKKKEGEKNGKDKYIYQLVKKDRKDKSYYIHGIKQMISHYIGIKNLMNGEPYNTDENGILKNIISKDGNGKEVKNGYKLNHNVIVILGEIVFKLPLEKGQTLFERYQDKYNILAKIIAKQESKNSQFEIMEDLLEYSDVYKNNGYEEDNNVIRYKVDNIVRQYYGWKDK